MRLATTALAVLLATLIAPPWAAAQPTEMRIELRVEPADGRIHGRLSVELPGGEARFRLDDGFVVEAVRLESRDRDVAADAAGAYLIEVDPGGGLVEVTWSAVLPSEPRAGLAQPYLGPAGGFLPPGSAWFPRFEDVPVFALQLEAQIDGGQRLVASGSLVTESDERDRYTARFAHPRTFAAAVATGPWELRELRVGEIRVRTLFPAELDHSHAQTYLSRTAQYVELFESRAGPYPFSSFTVAASLLPVGVAYPGFTLLGEQVIPLPFIPETSLAHELLHGWWGNGVHARDANWLEGLTTYMADYHLDERRGAGLETRRRWLLDLAALPAAEEHPLSEYRGGNQGVQRSIGYHRAAMLFHMLRLRVGDEAFDAGARLLRQRHLFAAAGWDDLAAAFGDAAEEDLTAFFDAWVRRRGAPELSVHDVQIVTGPGSHAVVGRLRQAQEDAPWPVVVPVVVTTSDGAQVAELLRLDERETSFRIALPDRTEAVELAVDPGYDVLRRRPEAPPILRGVTLDSRTRVVALDPGLEQLGQQVLGHAAPSADTFEPDSPLLLLGSTENVARWLEEHAVPTAPLDLEERGAARAWAVPGTRLTVLSADATERLGALLQAIQRQGYLSYLVQDDRGGTLESGIWEAPPTELRTAL